MLDLSDVPNKELIKEIKSNPNAIDELKYRMECGELSTGDEIKLLVELANVIGGGWYGYCIQIRKR